MSRFALLRRSASIAALAGAALMSGAAVAAECDIAMPNFAFPSYNPMSNSGSDGTSTLTVNCRQTTADSNETVSYVIAFSTGSSNSYIARGFVGQPLEYNLYTDGGRTVVWGDGSQGSATVAGGFTLPGASSAMHTVYGRIPAGQQPDAGTVSDNIMITVDY